MMNEFNIVLAISIVSLLISLLSLFVAWFAYRRDRSDLKISVEFHPESEHGIAFQVHLVNNGRRPINIENILLRLKSGKPLLPKPLRPKIILAEKEDKEYWFPLSHYREDITNPLEVRQVEVYDASGKKYLFPISKIKKQITELWTQDSY